MEILFELNKKILLIFFANPTKIFALSAKKWNCKLKLQNYCRIKENISLNLRNFLKTF